MRPTKAQYDVAYKAAMKPGATDADKLALARMLSAACTEEVVSDIIEEPPFFTPSPAPIPPTAHHNVFPPITSEGIQEAAKRLQELRAQWDKEDAEIFASVPMPERLQPRVPDLCPDDMGFARVDIIKQEQRRAYESAHGPARGCDDCEEERNR